MSVISLILLALSSVFAPQRAEIVFAGDAMQHESQLKNAKTADGSYDYTKYYKSVEGYVKSADYAVVNLETPLGGAPYSGYPQFCAPDSYLEALRGAGFDMVLTANNHMLDRRDKGLKRTTDYLTATGMPFVGAYRNKAQRDSILPMIKDINGFKVAFLNYTYGTNGIEIQGDVVVDYINRDKMKTDVERARRAGAEIIAMCIHWGDEYKLLPNAAQKDLAKYVKSLGVDLIIGGHPHVIQPMELKPNETTGKNQLLVYSLGNFVSGMKTTDTVGGAMIKVGLERDASGRAIVKDASYQLVYVVPLAAGGYYLVPAEEAAKSGKYGMATGFYRNATDIFNKHNINVGADPKPLKEYKTYLMLPEMIFGK